MSLKKLLFWTFFDLGLAVLIGLCLIFLHFSTLMYPSQPAKNLYYCQGLHSLGVPLTAPGVREKYERASAQWQYGLFMDCEVTPADDHELVNWLRTNAAIEAEAEKRLPSDRSSKETAVTVYLLWLGPKGQEVPEIPWKELGYQPAQGETPKRAAFEPFVVDAFIAEGPPPATLLLIDIGYLHIGLLLVGLVRWWRNRRVASGPPPRGEGSVLPVAVFVGLALGGFFWVYVQVVRHFLGPGYGLPDYLSCIPSTGFFMPPSAREVWMTVDPPALQLVTGVCVALAAPLVQELFYRGGLLGMWMGAGRFWAGALQSALGVVVFVMDWNALPMAIVVGLTLALLYRWSRSLVATLLANILFSSAMLCIVYGLIPLLPYPVELLCGQWEGSVDPVEAARLQKQEEDNPVFHFRPLPPPDVEFLRGGYIKGGVDNGNWPIEIGIRPEIKRTPIWFHWVDSEHIEVRCIRKEVRGRTLTETLEVVRYKVAVSFESLTLTRESDGHVFFYRRGP